MATTSVSIIGCRSLITYTASRNISSQPQGVGNTGQGSNYDAYYAIIAANNPGASPEAIRTQVSQVLQDRGIPADGSVVNGFLTNRPSLQSRNNSHWPCSAYAIP
jgi:hypothetical protein